jgi:hypothetical protein
LARTYNVIDGELVECGHMAPLRYATSETAKRYAASKLMGTCGAVRPVKALDGVQDEGASERTHEGELPPVLLPPHVVRATGCSSRPLAPDVHPPDYLWKRSAWVVGCAEEGRPAPFLDLCWGGRRWSCVLLGVPGSRRDARLLRCSGLFDVQLVFRFS